MAGVMKYRQMGEPAGHVDEPAGRRGGHAGRRGRLRGGGDFRPRAVGANYTSGDQPGIG
jgi:hypothetical protein